MPALDDVEHGMIVLAVIRNSPAEKGGLLKHDIVLTVDRQKLKSTKQLKAIVAGKSAQSELKCTVLRLGKTIPLTVTLGRTSSAGPAKQIGVPADGGPGAAMLSAGHVAPRFYTSVSLIPAADDIYNLEIRYRQGIQPESIMQFSGTMPELREAVARQDRIVLSNVTYCLSFFSKASNRSRMRFKVTPHFVQGWKFVRVIMVRRLKDGTPSLYSLDKRVVDNGSAPLADVLQNDSFASQLSELQPKLRRSIEQSIKNYNSLTSPRPNPPRRPTKPGNNQGNL